jgi:hypothetical protein
VEAGQQPATVLVEMKNDEIITSSIQSLPDL